MQKSRNFSSGRYFLEIITTHKDKTGQKLITVNQRLKSWEESSAFEITSANGETF